MLGMKVKLIKDSDQVHMVIWKCTHLYFLICMAMTVDVMLNSYNSILCPYVAYAMFMRLKLKSASRTYVFKIIKTESMHVHRFYK